MFLKYWQRFRTEHHGASLQRVLTALPGIWRVILHQLLLLIYSFFFELLLPSSRRHDVYSKNGYSCKSEHFETV